MQTRERSSFFAKGAVIGAALVGMLLSACDPAEAAALPPPGPNAIEIAIATEPPGAAVSVDGVPLGNAPQKAKLNPGPHTIRAFKSGYFNVDQRVTVASGEPTEHLLTLIASH